MVINYKHEQEGILYETSKQEKMLENNSNSASRLI